MGSWYPGLPSRLFSIDRTYRDRFDKGANKVAGYQDLIKWCNSTATPGNRQTAVSVNLYEVHVPGHPASAEWVGTLSPVPSAPGMFELDGTLQPLKGQHPVHLHVVINVQNPANEHAGATISGQGIKPEWHTDNPVIVYNEIPNYHGDAVISGAIEIIPSPATVGSMLYPIILGPTYTYHPPTP